MRPVLDAQALTYTCHAQPAPSFHEVSLELGAGERLFITGSSGGGKSTLARCLVGLIPHPLPRQAYLPMGEGETSF